MVRAYPIEWLVVASVPMLLWIALFAFGSMRSRTGSVRVRANVLAILGAFLALVSFATEWGVSESGWDWVAVTSMSLFLLFTYPLAMITPLAGLGQVGMLLWVLGYAQEHDARIWPWSGYLLAWLSAALMIAGMVWPAGLSGKLVKPDLYDRLLTLTIRRQSGHWMSGRHALAVVLSAVFVFVGGASLALRRDADAMLLLIVGLVFILYMLRIRPLARIARRELAPTPDRVAACARCGAELSKGTVICGICGADATNSGARVLSTSRGVGVTTKSNLAWILFVGASYAAVVIGFAVIVGSFGASGYSGEEKTALLVKGVIALVFIVPVAVIAQRRAVAPPLPRNLTMASVIIFSLFILMASLGLSGLLRTGFSASEYMVFAGIALIGPAVFFLQTKSGEREPAGGQSS